ncbi:lysophospholipid acyltransferase family protein [Amycolatopsis sp. NPDC049252]|uniref:lysophospholipid acyltransferase family protein n=1 Tax=Amycolatopsis sp. NPDC049252 TaxID=3363933 RepID=UPI00370FA2E0
MSHSWMPTSPCGDDCLTGGDPVVAFPRRVLRFVSAIVVVFSAMLASPLLIVARGRGREQLVRLIFHGVLRAFGVRLDIRGGDDFRTAAAGRGALVVNNHISWLDIVAINALRPMRALAKKEIAGWPVLGGLVRRGGSIFLDRERLKTLPATMAELADALRSGSLVSVTPEGTTWCGLASGRFTTATFQAAIDGGVPVRPIALRYRLADGRETSRPAFIGPESLIASLRRVAALRGLVLEVHICPEIAPGRAETRHELAALAEAAVHSALGTVKIPGQQRRRTQRPQAVPSATVSAPAASSDVVLPRAAATQAAPSLASPPAK